jgi:hypothetical protein
MVSYTGRASDPRRIRRLKSPLSLEVEADTDGTPLRLRVGGAWQDVTLGRKPWRIDQHWWRAEAIKRTYFRVVLPDAPSLTIYYDAVRKAWFRQQY